jgi:hypothetical protein
LYLQLRTEWSHRIFHKHSDLLVLWNALLYRDELMLNERETTLFSPQMEFAKE